MSNLELRVRLTLIDEILGTAAADPKIHETYIASKAPDAKNIEEEVAAIGADAVAEEKKDHFLKRPRRQPCDVGISDSRILQERVFCSEDHRRNEIVEAESIQEGY